MRYFFPEMITASPSLTASKPSADTKGEELARSILNKLRLSCSSISEPTYDGENWVVGARHWGEWESDIETKDEDDDDDWAVDDDHQRLSNGSQVLLKKMLSEFAERNPDFTFGRTIDEKNWITIYVKAKSNPV